MADSSPRKFHTGFTYFVEEIWPKLDVNWGWIILGLLTVALLIAFSCYVYRNCGKEKGSTTLIRYRAATPGRPRRSWQLVPVQPSNPPPTPELVKNDCCCLKVVVEEDGDTISI